MQLLKGQSDIIAVVMILGLAIGLLGVAYTFGLPLINKNQDEALDKRAQAFFSETNINSIQNKIQAVANSGGKDQVTIDLNGVVRLYPYDSVAVENNSLEFTFTGTVSSKNTDGKWVSLTGGACPPANGVLGQDEPAVICAKASRTGSGHYNITYKMFMRELEDAEKRNGFKINLVKHPSSQLISSGEKRAIRMEFDRRSQQTVGPKTLITTDVKILLI
ncbi:MAG: hypothetical protein HY833_03325 [Candidatus Aenigmarchaeota archaeon]|nr:hypothetical protein [Candidatus Aenigmarchaeota archaeon]